MSYTQEQEPMVSSLITPTPSSSNTINRKQNGFFLVMAFSFSKKKVWAR